MHPAIELISLRRAAVKVDGVAFADKNYFVEEILKKDMFYLPQEMIEKTAERIWSNGIKIGLMAPTDDPNICKLTITLGDNFDEALKKKWIIYRLKRRIRKMQGRGKRKNLG